MNNEINKKKVDIYNLNKRIYTYSSMEKPKEGLLKLNQGKYIDIEGLNDIEKLSLVIYTLNCWDNGEVDAYVVTKNKVAQVLGWSIYKVTKTVKQISNINVETAFNLDTGLLSGKGYVFYK